jgi:tRNA (adenine37-N6)-methyltransferase
MGTSRSSCTVEPEVPRRVWLRPIGVVRSPVTRPLEHGWGQVVSTIRVTRGFGPGLRGVESFSHLAVLFVMHQARFRERDLVRRPRRRRDMPPLGIFAQRASCRPNLLGLTVVRLLRRQGALLEVRGLDAIDGSPVLDLKPHVRAFDSPGRPLEPEWMGRLMTGYF